MKSFFHISNLYRFCHQFCSFKRQSKFLICLLFAFTFLASDLKAQTELFLPNAAVLDNLSSTARAKYDKAISLAMYDAFEVKDINIDAVSDPLGLVKVSQSLFAVSQLVYSPRHLEYSDRLNYIWNGEYNAGVIDPNLLDYASIAVIVENGNAFGQINLDGEIIDFTTLEGKTVLLCKRKLQFDTYGECKQPNVNEQVDDIIEKTLDCNNSVIRILVSHNQAAADDVININETAAIAVNQTKTVLSNSGLSYLSNKIVLAGTVLTTIELNSTSLEEQLQNIFGSLSATRNAKQADIVMFLVGQNELNAFSIFGLAADIPANFSESWAIVEAPVSTSRRRTFAHEFFHLLGGWHNDDLTSVAGNHRARKFTACNLKNRCTILTSGATVSGCWKEARIEYLSSPTVNFQCRKTGKSDRNNKQAVINNFSNVAGFYPDINLNLNSLNIVNPECSNIYVVFATATASTPCMAAPLKYKWRTSANGINFPDWSNLFSSSNTLSVYMTQPDNPATASVRYVECLVQDANGVVAIISGQAVYYCPSFTGDNQEENAYALVQKADSSVSTEIRIYPNPVVNGMLFLEIQALIEGDVRMDVFDLAGRLIDQSVFSVFSNEASNFSYESLDLKPGSYTFIFHVENESPISHLVIITN